MAMADVTVLGAGIFGLSIAWACTQKGAAVRVIDPYGPGAGSSGGIVGALAPHVPENWNDKKAFQLDSLLMAADFWNGVEAASGMTTGYARSGRLQPIADAAGLDLARARALSAASLWQGLAKWEVVRADSLDGWKPDSPSGWLIRDTLTARLHPRKACAALVAALVSKGAQVVADGPMEGAVIHATGVAGLSALNAALTRSFGNGVKGQAALLSLDMRDAPQLFVDTVHIIPHADGTVAIGSTSERDYDDPASTDDQLEQLIDRARAAVPDLRDAPVIGRWAGVRPRSRSRAPVLGVHPVYSDQFIANGGFKIGFGMAPKVAQVMADLVLDEVDHIPAGFRPEASL
jgi:glycine oxidase